MSLGTRQVGLIAEYTGRFSVRSGTGLVFLMVALIAGLLVTHIVVQPLEATQDEMVRADEDEAAAMLVEMARPVVGWIVERGADDEAAERWTHYLLDEKPALLSAVLLLLSFVWPFLITLGSFNQFSGDVGSRRIRYLLLRVPRSRLYLGRALGTAAFGVAALLPILIVAVLYLGFRADLYGWGELVVWAGWGLVALIVLIPPYVALAGWISTAIDSPFGSLSVASLVVGGVPLAALLAGQAWEPAGWLRYLTPWGVQHQLLHYQWLNALGAILACFAYTGVFAYLGRRHFLKRDL